MRKIERALRQIAAAYGATVEASGAGHIRIRGKGWTITTAGTPKNLDNTIRNVQRDVRKASLAAA